MKYSLSLLLATIIFYAQAQTQKGSFLISGGLSYSHTKNTSNFSSVFNSLYITPRAGYFIRDRFAVGLSLPLVFSKAKYDSPSVSPAKRVSRSLGVGPFVRYYIPLKGKIFVLTEVGYSWNFTTTDSDDNTQKETSRQYNAGAGVAYLINRNVGLELLAGYRKITNTGGDFTDSSIRLEGGLQIYLSR
jgi:hypothetical protein